MRRRLATIRRPDPRFAGQNPLVSAIIPYFHKDSADGSFAQIARAALFKNLFPRRKSQIHAAMPGQSHLKLEPHQTWKGNIMKQEPRWLKSTIAAAATAQVSLPWQRQNRSRPAAFKPVVAKPAAIAAR